MKREYVSALEDERDEFLVAYMHLKREHEALRERHAEVLDELELHRESRLYWRMVRENG